MQWLKLEGSHYEIGYQLGHWWGLQLKSIKRSSRARMLVNGKHGSYEDWLINGWKEEYWPLLTNTAKYFPGAIKEISGMCDGVASSGFKTNFESIFGLVIADTDSPKLRCSTIAVPGSKGAYFVHNEEEDVRYPLCYADICLRKYGKAIRFRSISYPFQLPGSCFGMNRHYAFQGNSIGFMNQQKSIADSWKYRVPKTIMSRAMLEMNRISDVISLYEECHTTLPYHHYLCFGKAVYSLSIKPVSDPSTTGSKLQVNCRRVKSPEIHTNHFLSNGEFDNRWSWGKYDLDSRSRYSRLQRWLTEVKAEDFEKYYLIMKKMREIYQNTTSATIGYGCSINQLSFKSDYYFWHKPKEIFHQARR